MTRTITAARLGLWASIAILLATPLSGPVGFLIVGAIAPQPPWSGPALFTAAYHPVQALPFAVGFALVAAFVALHVAIVQTAQRAHRTAALLSLAFACVFAAIISLNYINQTAVVPAAARRGDLTSAVAISLLSMANPSSIAWSLEMFGYGFLGLASLAAAPVFHATRVDRAVRALLIANAVVSVVGAAATAAAPGWVLSPLGIASYFAWNGLVLALSALLAISFRARLRPHHERTRDDHDHQSSQADRSGQTVPDGRPVHDPGALHDWPAAVAGGGGARDAR